MTDDLYQCGNDDCCRVITKQQMRTRHFWGSRSEPGYDEPGCVFCTPDATDLAGWRDARDEQRLDELREQGDL